MKNFTTRIKTCLLALLLAVVCVLPLGTFRQTKASAFSFNRGNTPNTIYYYGDSEELLSASELTAEYPGYNVVYDIDTTFNQNDVTELAIIVDNGAISFGDNCIVILQFMNTLLNGILLEDLISQIEVQGAEIVFISGFEEDVYDINFQQRGVSFLYCETLFHKFVIDASLDIDETEPGSWEGLRLYIDGSFALSLSSNNAFLEFEGDDQEAYEVYFNTMVLPYITINGYLEYLFDEFVFYLDVELPQESEYEDRASYKAACYFTTAWEMKNAGIQLLVHCDEYDFFDIIQGKFISFTTYDEENNPILDEDKLLFGEGDYAVNTKTYAMAAVPMESELYEVLLALQSDEAIINIYVFVNDPDAITEEGELTVITDEMLRILYRSFDLSDAYLLLEILDEIIG